jgi:hypothetical protein
MWKMQPCFNIFSKQDWMTGIRIPTGAKIFVPHHIQTDSGSYSVGARVKAAGVSTV